MLYLGINSSRWSTVSWFHRLQWYPANKVCYYSVKRFLLDTCHITILSGWFSQQLQIHNIYFPASFCSCDFLHLDLFCRDFHSVTSRHSTNVSKLTLAEQCPLGWNGDGYNTPGAVFFERYQNLFNNFVDCMVLQLFLMDTSIPYHCIYCLFSNI